MTSDLEQAWDARPTSDTALACVRVDEFDRHSGLFYLPTTYKATPADGSEVDVPAFDEESVGALLRDFVRDEFGRTTELTVTSPPTVTLAPPAKVSLDAMADELVASVETELLYGGSFEQFAADVGDRTIPQRLHALFCHEQFGRRENAAGTPESWFEDALRDFSEAPQALWLAVPGLPFRDQNPFRSTDPPDAVTLAEALFLARLHAISLAVYQVVPAGLHVVILSDGSLYADALGVDPSAAESYFQRVRTLRNLLNMQGTVSVIDYLSVVEGAAMAGGVDYHALVDEIESVIGAAYRTETWSGVTAHRSLVAGMRWNINWHSLPRAVPLEELWRLLACPVDELLANAEDDPVRAEILRRSHRYAAMNLALRFLSPVSRLLPGSLRGTMHPKPGQIGLPRLGSVFPWNGVAAIGDSTVLSPRDIRIDPLYRLAGSSVYQPLIDPERGGTTIAYAKA